jgi:hypothetical protein
LTDKKNLGEFTINELIEFCLHYRFNHDTCEKCDAELFCRFDKKGDIRDWYVDDVNLTIYNDE